MGFTPSSGDELQSELLLPRGSALDAVEIVRGLAGDMAPHLLISEIRTVAADTLWMSPQYERDTVAFHFTWRPHIADVTRLVTRLETALAAFEPRPHWGKIFTSTARRSLRGTRVTPTSSISSTASTHAARSATPGSNATSSLDRGDNG